MTRSILWIREKVKNRKKTVRLWAVAVWLLVWQGMSVFIGEEMLLASPVSVFIRLFELVQTAPFWKSVAFTLLRITGGFLAAVIVGLLLAALSARFFRVKELISPLVQVMQATPVASFTILILIWVSSKNLSLFMALLMVMPILYTNVLSGIENTNRQLLEMTKVFRVPFGRRLRFVYIPQVLPFFRSASKVAIGLCWKAGVAAEVIGMPTGSVGERLYQAKIYLETTDLFAWTVTIVVISILFEKLFLLLLDKSIKQIERL